MTDYKIEAATRHDVGIILSMIFELAELEGCAAEVVATEELLLQSLFGASSISRVLIASVENAPVGYMIYCPKFTSFTGRNELYLQNVYLRPDARGKGMGRALMCELARVALKENSTRIEWFVEQSNTQALSFYESLGAEVNDAIRVVRLDGENLKSLADRER